MERMAREVASKLVQDADLVIEAVRRMGALELKSVLPFAAELGQSATNRLEAFKLALEMAEGVPPRWQC
jgi:hypothetical protein